MLRLRSTRVIFTIYLPSVYDTFKIITHFRSNTYIMQFKLTVSNLKKKKETKKEKKEKIGLVFSLGKSR